MPHTIYQTLIAQRVALSVLSIPFPDPLHTFYETRSGAAAMALVRLKPRLVPMFMYGNRVRLVMCEVFKVRFFNAIFMLGRNWEPKLFKSWSDCAV